jgi:capsular polysaccharide biosynthesis protein
LTYHAPAPAPEAEAGAWQGEVQLARVTELRTAGDGGGFKVRYAVRDHLFLAIAPVIVLVAVAGFIAMKRTPTYTAQSQLTLGQLDVAAQAPSYVTAAQGLAATYARAIHAGDVTNAAGKALHIPPLQASSRLQASPVGNTPLFFINATGHSEKSAVKLANVASHALVRYVSHLNQSAAAGGKALASYKRASRSQHRWQIEAGLAQQAYGKNPTAANRRALQNASQNRDQASLRAQVLAQVYANAKRTGATSNVLQVLAPATNASSDRDSMLQKLMFAALAAGIAIGIALAVWRGSRPVQSERPRVVRAA